LFNVQRYLLGLLFTIMLFISTFHGIIDARKVHHHVRRPRNLVHRHHGYTGTHGRIAKHRPGHQY
jgi:hypothetical protein